MKQVQVLFIIILDLLVAQTHAQTQPDLDAWLRGFFTEANLPYRNLNGGISIQYKPGSNHDIVFATSPQGVLDQEFIKQASLELKDLLVSANSPALNMIANFKFDDLTDNLFLSPLKPMDDVNKIFVNYYVSPEVPGGTTQFFRRLNDYLLQLPDSVQQQVEGHSFRFDVEKDGHVTPIDSIPISKYLNPFLAQDRKWKPGIRCGRPFKTKATLMINIKPKKEDEQRLHYYISELYLEEYVLGLEDQKILYYDGGRQWKSPYNSMSFVDNNGKPDAFVYHYGNLAACKRMEEQVKASTHFGCYSQVNIYPRVEFYQYLEE